MKQNFALLFLLAAGCGATPAPQSKPAVPDAVAAPAVDAPAAPADAPAVDDSCYQECLKNSQARAVAWDQVERDCKGACGQAGGTPSLELKKSE